MRYNSLPFSPHYAFSATRALRINGVDYAPGDAIDVSAVGERRLRQLYETRKVTPHAPDFLFNGPAPQRQPEQAPAAPPAAPEQSTSAPVEPADGQGAPVEPVAAEPASAEAPAHDASEPAAAPSRARARRQTAS